jgi:1-acyl-sn-glycerol-3-phosphate acyltransferase
MSSPPIESNARSRAKKSAERNGKHAFDTLTALVARWPGRGEQPFEGGVGVLAQGTHAAIVPAAIDGTFAAWPKHRRWPRAKRVRVAFGAPVDLAGVRQPTEIRSSLESAVRRLLAGLCTQSADGASSSP